MLAGNNEKEGGDVAVVMNGTGAPYFLEEGPAGVGGEWLDGRDLGQAW